MTGRGRGYRLATERAEAARARFLGDLSATKDRASPGRLVQDVRDGARAKAHQARAKAVATVKDRRFGLAALVALILSFTFRRQIAALSRRSWVGLRDYWAARRQIDENRSDDDGN